MSEDFDLIGGLTPDARLPRNLRRREAVERAAIPPYTRTPVTTEDGTPVFGWSGPVIPSFSGAAVNHDMSKSAIEDGPQDDDCPDVVFPDDRCHKCGGWGCWTETREGSDGRDVDVDYPCDHCDETGIEP